MMVVDSPLVPGPALDLCPDGKVHIIDEPMEAPGCCFLTRTSVGPFIDTFRDVDELPDHGRLYLAAEFVQGLASQYFGMVPGDRADALVTENRALRDQLDAKDRIIEAERKTIAGFRDAGYVPRTRRTPQQIAADAMNGVDLDAPQGDPTSEEDEYMRPTPTEIRHQATADREGDEVGQRVRHVQEIPQDPSLPDALANSPRPTNSPRAREGTLATGVEADVRDEGVPPVADIEKNASNQSGGSLDLDGSDNTSAGTLDEYAEFIADFTVRVLLAWVSDDPDYRGPIALAIENSRDTPRKGITDALTA